MLFGRVALSETNTIEYRTAQITNVHIHRHTHDPEYAFVVRGACEGAHEVLKASYMFMRPANVQESPERYNVAETI